MIGRAKHRRWLQLLYVSACGVASCGLQPVELLPSAEPSAMARDVVLDDVPAAALAQLRAQRTVTGQPTLELLYPAVPRLAVPADLAALDFEWRATPDEPKRPDMLMPKPEPPDLPMPPMAASQPDASPHEPAPPAPTGADPVLAYELRLHGPFGEVRLYTSAQHAALPSALWQTLLRQHTGSTLAVDLRGVRQSGGVLHAPGLELSVRAPLPAGFFYSFSTTAQGVTRAKLSDQREVLVLPPAADAGTCVGCHAISSDGKRALVTSTDQPSLLLSSWQSEATVRIDWPADDSTGYLLASFDPTAARIAAARAGQLLLFDADTGELLERSAASLSTPMTAPDWSPDGRSITVITPDDPQQLAGGLATVSVALDGKLSAPQPLLTPGKDATLRAPRYSPDGEWIAFEKRMGPRQESEGGKLFLIRAGGSEPIELRGLAQGAKPMDGASAPAFVPGDRPERAYLLFSSGRSIGSFTPAPGQLQLFAAELDLARAAEGRDPSGAAFWLPFQQRTSSYRAVQWARALASCTASPEVCDSQDDDCDGAVDETCCQPEPELCDDASDNDCDGAVDEGCGCAFIETCDNERDDDCDRQTDEDPCVPPPAMH